MKKLLIFDAYGTLFSTGTGSVDATKKILSLQSQPLSPQQFYSQWKQMHRLHMDKANESVFLPERKIFEKDLAALYQHHNICRPWQEDVHIMLQSLLGRKLYPDVKEAVHLLRTRFRMVIGSTTDTAPLLENLAAEGLQMDAIYTSELIGKYKPHPDFYRHILAREDCPPRDALFIGDSLADDVFGPAAVGIDAAWVNRSNAPLPPAAQPFHVIDDLRKLPALLL